MDEWIGKELRTTKLEHAEQPQARNSEGLCRKVVRGAFCPRRARALRIFKDGRRSRGVDFRRRSPSLDPEEFWREVVGGTTSAGETETSPPSSGDDEGPAVSASSVQRRSAGTRHRPPVPESLASKAKVYLSQRGQSEVEASHSTLAQGHPSPPEDHAAPHSAAVVCEASELFVTNFLSASYLFSLHAKRKTLMRKDPLNDGSSRKKTLSGRWQLMHSRDDGSGIRKPAEVCIGGGDHSRTRAKNACKAQKHGM
ncbi:uncharacterized protein ISCGN_022541 [Ixodes scapularis]